MQYKTILKVLGIILMLFSLSMLTPVIVIEIYHDSTMMPYLQSFLLTFGTGLAFWYFTKNANRDLKIRDGFLLTVSVWVILCAFAALPFMLTKDPHIDFTDAMFESVSGLTTTGSSVLSGLDFMPHAILFYRQQLQFLGGMGIIVLAVAILPMLGIGGMQLYQAEVPGPVKDSKLTPRITETAKTLWYLYVGLTVLCALAYYASGMNFFNALGESFATVSTGGFSMHDNSFLYYHSPFIELVCVIFMILGGTNFSLHFYAMRYKSLNIYWKDTEFKAYIYLLLGVSFIAAATLIYYDHYLNANTAIIKSLFDVTSLITTTGFVAGSFNQWPTFVPFLIMSATLIGGCGGSTSGGMKVIRVVIALKQSFLEVKRLIHPNSVLTLKLNKKILPNTLSQAIWAFITIFMVLTVVFTALLISQGFDIRTAYSAVIASIANAGAALGEVSSNFEPLNNFSKWVLIIAMLAGRLEIFTLLVLFTPSFWKK